MSKLTIRINELRNKAETKSSVRDIILSSRYIGQVEAYEECERLAYKYESISYNRAVNDVVTECIKNKKIKLSEKQVEQLRAASNDLKLGYKQ